MSVEKQFSLRNPFLLMALAAVYPASGWAVDAANADFTSGQVWVVNAAGAQRQLIKGGALINGDTIRTGEGARAQLRFTDGALVSLQPQSEFRIDNYEYSGKTDGQEKGFFSLLKGGLRTITGFVGRSNRDSYKVTTSVATIGIRGTEYTAGLNALGTALDVSTGEGLVEVCNETGCILIASGESATVQGSGQPQKSNSPPLLPPPSVPGDAQPVFSSGSAGIGSGIGAGGLATVGGIAGVAGGVYRDNATITLNGDGSLNGFVSGALASNQGSAQAVDYGGDSLVSWTRWTNGTVTIDNASVPITIDQGGHLFWGTPTATMPASGTASFTLLGATSPTEVAGFYTPGTLSACAMSVNFGTGAYSVSLNGTVNAGAVAFSGSGTGTLAGNTIPSTSLTGLIGACIASGSLSGRFFGASAERAGVVYLLDAAPYKIVGAAAMKQ